MYALKNGATKHVKQKLTEPKGETVVYFNISFSTVDRTIRQNLQEYIIIQQHHQPVGFN